MKITSILKLIFVPVRVAAQGVNCDVCGWRTEIKKLTPEWVLAKCPECGSALLTPEEYVAAVRHMRVRMFVNIVGLPLHWLCLIYSGIVWLFAGLPMPTIAHMRLTTKPGSEDIHIAEKDEVTLEESIERTERKE